MRTRCQTQYIAVSYTHLDVYKRQVHLRVGPQALKKAEGVGASAQLVHLVFGILGIAEGDRAVGAYLDVYKRQLLNSTHPSIADVLLKIISLEFHPTVMAAEGEGAYEQMMRVAEKFKGKFIFAVEGAVPVAHDGKCCVCLLYTSTQACGGFSPRRRGNSSYGRIPFFAPCIGHEKRVCREANP